MMPPRAIVLCVFTYACRGEGPVGLRLIMFPCDSTLFAASGRRRGDGRTPPPQTLELSEARQKQGPMPNVITHNASISAFEKGERPEHGAGAP